jgi:hypothetical protein
MEFHMDVNLDGAALHENAEALAELLEKVADRVRAGEYFDTHLQDINGNPVGSWDIAGVWDE